MKTLFLKIDKKRNNFRTLLRKEGEELIPILARPSTEGELAVGLSNIGISVTHGVHLVAYRFIDELCTDEKGKLCLEITKEGRKKILTIISSSNIEFIHDCEYLKCPLNNKIGGCQFIIGI